MAKQVSLEKSNRQPDQEIYKLDVPNISGNGGGEGMVFRDSVLHEVNSVTFF